MASAMHAGEDIKCSTVKAAKEVASIMVSIEFDPMCVAGNNKDNSNISCTSVAILVGSVGSVTFKYKSYF